MFRTVSLLALIAVGVALSQDSQPTSKPAAAKSVMDRLREQTLNLDAVDQPLSELLALVAQTTKLNVVLGPSCPADAELSLSVQDLSVKATLDLIGSSVKPKLSWSLVDDLVVHVHPATAKAPHRPKLDAAWLEKHGARTLEANFPDTALSDVAEFLQALFGVQCTVDDALLDAPVNLSLSAVPLPTFLTLLAEQVGASWSVQDGVVHLAPAK